MKSRVYGLKEHGQSLWLDYLDRDLIAEGTLKRMIEEDGLSGVTSNPTIFKKAIDTTDRYDDQCRHLIGEGKSVEDAYDELTREDVSMACDILQPVFDETGGRDGYCSLELLPSFAYDAEGSVREAKRLDALVKKENAAFKVPGTDSGLDAIRRLTSEGINVNITLLFSPEQYAKVAEAYIDGIEKFIEGGGDPRKVFSVASFFLSRIDTKVDKKLDEMIEAIPERAEALRRMRGSAAIATAKVAYARFREMFSSERWRRLESKGARLQKVLWASMSSKDPEYSDIKYVSPLIGPETVVTVPESTLEAMRDHLIIEDTLEIGIDAAPTILERLEEQGIDMKSIYRDLEREGVDKFETSYREVIESLSILKKRLAA